MSASSPFWMLDVLNAKHERRVIAERFASRHDRQKTLKAVGQGLGLSLERVRQIQNLALCKLRKVLRREDFDDNLSNP